MASMFSVPSLKTLVTRVAADYKAELGADASIRRSFPYALARAQAALAHGLYGLVQKAVQETHPWTATSYGVLFWASVLDVQRKPAVAAVITVDFIGTGGAEIPAGTVIVRDDAAEFESLTDVTLDGGGDGSCNVVALVAGAAGNTASGATYTIATPIAGVTSVHEFGSTVTDGEDEELLSALKTRYLEVLAKPPQGGANADYEAWTRETPGVDVDKVWVTPLWADEGSVLVRFTVTGDDPIPSNPDVTAVDDYIDGLRPVCAGVTVAAPIAHAWTFDVTLTAKTGYVLADVKAAVYAEIRRLYRDATPGGIVKLSNLDAAISRAPGEDSHVITAMDGGGGTEAAGDLDLDFGEIPILEDDGITWA